MQAERPAIRGEHGGAEEQQDEPVVVADADAVVDEDAVVVKLADAALADAAVLGAGRLEEPAGAALGAGVEDGEVEGVPRHLARVVSRGDEARVAEGGEVEEEVREEDGDGARGLLQGPELRPDGWEVQVLADGEEEEEEDLFFSV